MRPLPDHAAPSTGAGEWPILDPRAQLIYLLGEWRSMFRRATILADLMAGVSVALVALPLSLAIAAASGVPPAVGLVTAILGGIVVPLFGGCRLQVSGPAAAMTFLVSEIATKYGLSGLVAATLMAAALQLLAGLFRFGRFIQLIPRPVITGFLSGIGLTILCTQLPVILGYEVSHDEEGGALALLWQTMRRVRETNPGSLAVGITAIAVMLILPRVHRRLPTPLIAVAAASLLPALPGWQRVALLGPLPDRFPAPVLPVVPWGLWNELVMAALAVFLLASLESLLSASVVDSLTKGASTDHDQELIGQGLGNLTSALFGGIPVTGVIARSATNIQAGARTRLSAIVHALILLAMMFGLGPLVARIPRAALAGVLVAVALRMVEVRTLRALWRGSRAEAAVFVATAGAIVLTDLIVGIPVGMIGAFLYVVYEMSRLDVRPVPLAEAPGGLTRGDGDPCPAVRLMRVEGPLFFASGYHLRSVVGRLNVARCLILDLERVPFLDVTGAGMLEEAVDRLRRLGSEVILAHPSDAVFRRLRGMSRDDCPALRGCPVYGDLRDAMLHATTEVRAHDLCRACRGAGQCAGLERALADIGEFERTVVPRVRAVIAPAEGDGRPAEGPVHDGGRSAWPADALLRESIPTDSPPSRSRRTIRPVIDPSAFVDPLAGVVGEVAVGEHVSIGPGASVRADDGAPLHIGAGTSLQDGATLHARKGRVILVRGRPYAIYIGRDVCLTHHALVHGPCYVGDRCFLGFKATVHDAIVGEGCVLGLGAVVVGVSLPPGRYVGHNVVVDTQEKAEALPAVDARGERLRDEVAEEDPSPQLPS